MDTDETKLVNGRTITARDMPGPAHSGGCYRHYEVEGVRFSSVEEAESYAVALGAGLPDVPEPPEAAPPQADPESSLQEAAPAEDPQAPPAAGE